MAMPTFEIVCSACKADTMVRKENVFDGFRKTGEQFICVSCGHKYADERSVPFRQKKQISVFGDGDKVKPVSVFREDERGKTCRNCRHYLLNPFTQRCGLHFKEVQATDYCQDFERKAQSAQNGDGRKP